MQSKQLSQALVIALITSAGLTLNPAFALSPTPNPTAQPSYPSWNSGSVYISGQRVSYNGAVYEARWWTQGNNPAEAGEWGAWKLVSTVSASPSPTPFTIPSTLITEPLASTRPMMGGTCSNPSPSAWQDGQQISAGQIVSVGAGFSNNGGMLVFKAIAAHLSSLLNKPTVNSTSVSYDSSLWQSGAWFVPPCPTITPLPTATPVITSTPAPTPLITATPTPTASSSAGTWNSATAYTAGKEVIYNGRRYRAKWWVQGQAPNLADPWGPWEDLGPVSLTTATPAPTASAIPTPCQVQCSTPSPTPTVSASPTPTPINLVINSVQTSTWKNGAKGAYSLVHDDYCSMYYGTDPYIKLIDPELTKRGLVAGFGIITGSCSEQHWAAAKDFITHGHEIVSHSRNHPDPYISDAALEVQLNGSAADIAANLNGYKASYFIWPSDAASTVATDFLKNNTGYIGGRASHLVANGTVDYTTMPAGLNPANFDNPFRIKWDLFTVDGKWSLYPMGSEILNLHIDAAINQGVWATRTMHSVDTGYWETAPLARYQAHLDYAKAKVDAGELWMDTPSNVIKYRYAREYCKPILTQQNWQSIISFDTSAAQCQKYATPLTLQISSAQQGGGISAIQNGKALPVKAGPNNSYFVTADPLAGAVTFAYFMP